MKVPSKPSHPIAQASPASTDRSIATAAGAERHAVTFWFRTDAKRSPRAAIGSPDPTTYGTRRPVGARTCSAIADRSRRTASPPPLSGSGPSKAAVSAADVAESVCRSSRLARNSAASPVTPSASVRNSSAETCRGRIAADSLRSRQPRQRASGSEWKAGALTLPSRATGEGSGLHRARSPVVAMPWRPPRTRAAGSQRTRRTVGPPTGQRHGPSGPVSRRRINAGVSPERGGTWAKTPAAPRWRDDGNSPPSRGTVRLRSRSHRRDSPDGVSRRSLPSS